MTVLDSALFLMIKISFFYADKMNKLKMRAVIKQQSVSYQIYISRKIVYNTGPYTKKECVPPLFLMSTKISFSNKQCHIY